VTNVMKLKDYIYIGGLVLLLCGCSLGVYLYKYGEVTDNIGRTCFAVMIVGAILMTWGIPRIGGQKKN